MDLKAPWSLIKSGWKALGNFSLAQTVIGWIIPSAPAAMMGIWADFRGMSAFVAALIAIVTFAAVSFGSLCWVAFKGNRRQSSNGLLNSGKWEATAPQQTYDDFIEECKSSDPQYVDLARKPEAFIPGILQAIEKMREECQRCTFETLRPFAEHALYSIDKPARTLKEARFVVDCLERLGYITTGLAPKDVPQYADPPVLQVMNPPFGPDKEPEDQLIHFTQKYFDTFGTP